MQDLVFVAVIVAFFAGLWLFIAACDRIIGAGEPALADPAGEPAPTAPAGPTGPGEPERWAA